MAATCVASPVTLPRSTTSIQKAIAGLPPIPSTDPPLKSSGLCKAGTFIAVSQAQTSTALETHNASQSRSTPPATPINSVSLSPASQLPNISAPNGTLTPQTTSTSSFPIQTLSSPNAAGSAIGIATQVTTKKLKEAILSPCMPVDAQILDRWQTKIRSGLDEVLYTIVRHPLGYTQEVIFASERKRFYRNRGDQKPSIVVSVADSKDWKAVKKHCKKLGWLQTQVKESGLPLMVVIDVAKLQSKGQVRGDMAPTSMHPAVLTLDTSQQTFCGQKISVLDRQDTVTNSQFTLGGIVVIDNAAYGLTAGHAFFHIDNLMEASLLQRRTSQSSISSQTADNWLCNPTNPFVFPESDGSSPQMSTSDDSSIAGSESSTEEPYSDDRQNKEYLDRDMNHIIVQNVAVLVPSLYPGLDEGSKISIRNCDWALVELAQTLPLWPNRYNEKNQRTSLPITGTVTDAAPPFGEVFVIVSPDHVIGGYLSANPASYRVGRCLFDVRSVSLQEDLPLGCSGAWVIQNSTLCGYIIAARANPRWTYMTPIQSILDDIKRTTGANQVRIPSHTEFETEYPAHNNMTLGSVRDISIRQHTELIGQGDQFWNQGQTNFGVATDSGELNMEALRNPSSALYNENLSSTDPPAAPQMPEPAHRRPSMPGKKESSFSVTSREIACERPPTLLPPQPPQETPPTTTSLVRSAAENRVDNHYMPKNLDQNVLKALETAAYLICCPCIKILRPRHKHEDPEHARKSAIIENSAFTADQAQLYAPMRYNTEMTQRKEAIQHPMYEEVPIFERFVPLAQRSSHGGSSRSWAASTTLPRDQKFTHSSPGKTMSHTPSWTFSSDTNFHAPKTVIGAIEDDKDDFDPGRPSGDLAECGSGPLKGKQRPDADRDSVSIVLSAHDENQKEGSDIANQFISRSELDLGIATLPGIPNASEFRAWTLSPPASPLYSTAHTAISA